MGRQNWQKQRQPAELGNGRQSATSDATRSWPVAVPLAVRAGAVGRRLGAGLGAMEAVHLACHRQLGASLPPLGWDLAALVEPRGLGSPPRWAYLAGAPGRADALLRDCAGLRGCGRLSLCTHPSFNVRLARLSLMSLLYISKRDAGAFPRQALNIGAAPGPRGQNTARFERRIADLADGVPAPLYADAGLHARGPVALSCSPIFLLTCALCFGSVS